MHSSCSRRNFLGVIGATAGIWASRNVVPWSAPAGGDRVAIGMCHDYGPEVVASLQRMFDQLGGLQSLVKGKTVAVKLNLTGMPDGKVDGAPAGESYWVHPQVVGATIHLLAEAGAHRIRLLESPMGTTEPLENFMNRAGWRPGDFFSAAPRVELENTNYLGSAKRYSRFPVPGGGLLLKGFDLNHSYEDCDVFVSLAKLKEHTTAGVTLSMKNCFGNSPCTIYGDYVPEDEPSLEPKGGRGIFHGLKRLPPQSAPGPVDPAGFISTDAAYRVTRMTVDMVSARPIHLAIIDGIHTMAGGETAWVKKARYLTPGVLIAGRNCVATDAVGTAVMGFDPMANRGTPPFETCDSTLMLAEQVGLGTRDLKKIDVVGTPIEKARFQFRTA